MEIDGAMHDSRRNRRGKRQREETQTPNLDALLKFLKDLTSQSSEDDSNDFQDVDYQIFPILKADLPSSLNSLIALGMYMLHPRILIAEMEMCDFSTSLRDHPNFRNGNINSDFFLPKNDFIYDTSAFIKQLERKFMTTIYYRPPFPIEEGHELYNYLTLPDNFQMTDKNQQFSYRYLILNRFQKDLNGTIGKCELQLDFKYVYKARDLESKINDNQNKKQDISNETLETIKIQLNSAAIKFELRWVIAGQSRIQNLCSGSATLFFRIDSKSFLMIQNDTYQVVSFDDINNMYAFAYFCYERVTSNR